MTSPRKECCAAANLANQNYRSFLPLHLETRRHARKFRTVLAPVFPRYIFIILDVGQQRWRSVNGTLGVQSLITDGERPLAVARGVVETLIQSSDQRGALIFKADDLAVGDQVRARGGSICRVSRHIAAPGRRWPGSGFARIARRRRQGDRRAAHGVCVALVAAVA